MNNINLSAFDKRDFKIKKQKILYPACYTLGPTTIKNQQLVGSCVAHACSSAMEKYFNKIFSVGWIYGYRPFYYSQESGMCPREALKTLQKLGGVLEQDFAYNLEMPEIKNLVDSHIIDLQRLAAAHKITSYVRLQDSKEIKQWLYATHNPIPIVIDVANAVLKNNILIKNKSESINNHMVLIIGWNEQGFIFQNSWGQDWGNQGTAILPYDYNIKEAWGVSFEKKEQIKIKKKLTYYIEKLTKYIIAFIKK